MMLLQSGTNNSRASACRLHCCRSGCGTWRRLRSKHAACTLLCRRPALSSADRTPVRLQVPVDRAEFKVKF